MTRSLPRLGPVRLAAALLLFLGLAAVAPGEAAPDTQCLAPADPPPGASVSGRLLGVAPGDLARIQIQARTHGASVQGEVEAGGFYRIRELSPGEWEVVAVRDSGRPVRGSIRVEPGAVVEGPDLDLSGHTLTGRLLVDGEPPAAASAWVLGPRGLLATASTAVGPDGRFRLVGLAPGRSVLRLATPFGVHVHTFELEGDLDLAFDLATGWITGRVVSAAGEPVGGSRISLTDGKLKEEEVVADEQGAFSIPRALAGCPVLTVVVDGQPRLRSQVEVHPAAETFVELRLPGGH